MKFLLRYLKNYKALILIDFVAMFSFVLVELGIPTVMADIIDNGILTRNMPYIWKSFGLLLAIAVIGAIGSVVRGYCASKISSSITRDIRNDVFAKAQRYSHSEYAKFGVSSMITRTTNDAFQLMQFTNILLGMAMMTPIMAISSVVMIIKTSLQLSGVVALAIPFIVMGVMLIAHFAEPISQRQQKGMDLLNRISRENLTGVRVIRAFGNENYEHRRFEKTNQDYANTTKKMFKLMVITQPTFFLLLNIVVMIVIWISTNKISLGTMQVGNLVAFMEYLFHAMFSIMLFSMVFVMYPRARVSAERIQELLEEEPTIHNLANPVTSTPCRGEVEFDHVTFTYPDGEEAVLKDVSFTAKAGETVAFIGSTGSGKSTLINLIPRFYDVTKGSIKVDGVDIREYDLAALRKKIGFIPQKTLLFSGTIADNIRFGNQDATQEELVHAAQVAQAYDFISNKPEGFDAPISEGGTNVSGGQRQRLSIARAVARKPEIYIFDDSFSALDFKTDATLRARLKEETTGSVVFIVAQRVSSIMDADRIVVLNEGHVMGIGTHRELLKSCEIYREIAMSQLSKEELELE